MSNIWMAVSADEYELPFATADTAEELGEEIGLSKSAVKAKAHRDRIQNQKSDLIAKSKFRIIRVEVE